MKIAFMGSDPIALPLLAMLAEGGDSEITLEAVYTQPDRRSGRGQKIRPNEIKTWAIERGIPVRQPAKCTREESAYLRESGIDLVLVMAYGQILSSHLLKVPPLGVLNFHASILPRLRGASPIHTAIALGLEESGLSLMRIVPELDAGPVAAVEKVPTAPDDTSKTLHAKLARASVPLFKRCIGPLREGRLVFHEQDVAEVTYCRIIDKQDSHLDFKARAEELANRVRAFVLWPGTAFPYDGMEIRIIEASARDDGTRETPGTLQVMDDEVRIACGKGHLRLEKLQRPGGRPLPAAEFRHGFPLASGTQLESRPMRQLESPVPFPYRRRGNS